VTTPYALAPGVPADYYQRIREAEQEHWWYVGMRELSRALLGPRLRAGGRVLDAGCGTGGYLRWLLDAGSFSSAAGVDVASTAVELARERVPEADLRVAPLSALPFGDASFELVVTNDVLQHVDETELGGSLAELRRVLCADGTLLVRTNGSRRLRRERGDWRAYDRTILQLQLERAGFAVERITYANCLPSLWGAARGRVPHAPTEERHGVPARSDPRWQAVTGRALLRLEAAWLSTGSTSLPYGHTIFALARPR
jgi:ubiquinone/menaquinone biosynthesis C-methylase UbiE